MKLHITLSFRRPVIDALAIITLFASFSLNARAEVTEQENEKESP
jgi:hypothetical protein